MSDVITADISTDSTRSDQPTRTMDAATNLLFDLPLTIPLVLDVDGTLISGDLLYKSFLSSAMRNPPSRGRSGAHSRALRRWRGRGRRAVDDVEVNAAASGAAHRPVFGATSSADDAKHLQLAIAIRTIGAGSAG